MHPYGISSSQFAQVRFSLKSIQLSLEQLFLGPVDGLEGLCDGGFGARELMPLKQCFALEDVKSGDSHLVAPHAQCFKLGLDGVERLGGGIEEAGADTLHEERQASPMPKAVCYRQFVAALCVLNRDTCFAAQRVNDRCVIASVGLSVRVAN